jgi:preprotein translocase subunit Sss1
MTKSSSACGAGRVRSVLGLIGFVIDLAAKAYRLWQQIRH